MFKICKLCKQQKPIDKFYRDRTKREGRRNCCKLCENKLASAYRKLHADMFSRREKKRYQRRRKNPAHQQRVLIYNRQWRTEEKTRAHNTTARKLQHLKPEVCEECKIKPAQMAHHPDYSKPNKVNWICYCCHSLFRANLQTLGG